MFNHSSDNSLKIFVLVGLFLTIGSISLSLFLRFPFWYTPFIIGAWIFFGSLNVINKQPTIFALVHKRKLTVPILLYLLGALFGFLVDVVYGRTINSFWIYPFLPGSANWLVPVFIYYPIGLLHLYELYYLLKFVIEKVFPVSKSKPFPKSLSFIIYLTTLIGLVGVTLPVANYFFNHNQLAPELTIIAMVMTIFLTDSLDYLLSGTSVLLDLLLGKMSVLLTVLLSWLAAFALNELPNTYSHEWIYQNIPFTSGNFLGVNILVATTGWIFLVLITVRGVDLLRSLLHLFSKT